MMKWKTHRDQLSVVALGVIVLMLLMDLAARVRYQVGLPGEVVGFLITVGTLIFQFYFRKAGPANGGEEQP